jgi:CRISPR-associated exonuclease Cas4
VVSAAVFFALAVLALTASVYFWAMERRRGSVVYTDTDARQPGETLVSHRYGLIGRPDYVLRTKDGLVPVEVKSRSSGGRGPYPGETAQLFAYCLLVEEVTGEPVRSGVIAFADRRWPVAFGKRERRDILSILADMRDMQGRAAVSRDHAQAGKCRGCGFRAADVCGQALTG